MSAAAPATGRRVLVAGIGNIFCGDDGFGSEVARRLAGRDLGAGVEVVDVGIRGLSLALQLLDGYDLLVIVDAMTVGGPPGTLAVFEPDLAGVEPPAVADAHGSDPASVLALVTGMGGRLGAVRVVGCQPATLEEGIGLSEPVAAAVDPAVDAVIRAVTNREGGPP